MRKLVGGIAAPLIMAALASCGGARATAPRPVSPFEVKTYGPLGIKADAKLPSQAVILGTDDKNGSTIIPLAAGAGAATVDAMFVKRGDAPADLGAGMSAVTLATGPNADSSVQVASAGSQAAAGTWTSAFVAATTLGKDLTDVTFSATSGGPVDGVSASGLVAAGFLAALTGAPIDPTATLAGAVNPDGTIGPVDGLPEKLAAALAAGKKRIGYPIAMRMATSVKTGEAVDLVALAKQHGAEAIDSADVHAAYTLLTGKTLPAPVPVAATEMELDAPTKVAISAKYTAWQQKVASEWAAILQLESAGRLAPVLVYLRDTSKDYAEAAEALHGKGLVAAAYARMLAAWAYASSANQIYDVLSKVRANKLDDAVATLTELGKLDAATTAVFQKLGALKPPTIGGHLQMMAAFRSALRGWAFEVFASRSVAETSAYVKSLAGTPVAQLGSSQTTEALIARVAPSVLYVKKTVAETTLATEQLEFAAPADFDYTCSIPNVRRMATSFSSAGAAGLDHVDTLLVRPFATSAKISEDEARQRIAIGEPDYLVAMMATKLGSADGMMKDLREKWGESSLAWGLLSLAGSELAYFHSAELVAKYDSLGVTLGEDGQVTGIAHAKAFATMLAAAERNARANARAAKIATGAIPVQAKLAYQLAAVERDGTLAEKLDALGQFWTSSAFSQTAVMLARN